MPHRTRRTGAEASSLLIGSPPTGATDEEVDQRAVPQVIPVVEVLTSPIVSYARQRRCGSWGAVGGEGDRAGDDRPGRPAGADPARCGAGRAGRRQPARAGDGPEAGLRRRRTTPSSTAT